MVDSSGSKSVGERPTNGHEIEITLVGDGLCRIYWGNDAGGSYVNVPYEEIKDYVVSKRPRSELVDLYFEDSSRAAGLEWEL